MSPRFRQVLLEPMLHFVGLAVLVAIAGHYLGGDVDRTRHRITITPEMITRLAERYYRQYGTPPAEEQLRRLTDQYVREEILYREGIALGLDREDEIVRRRIVQKIDFLRQDLSDVPDPTSQELNDYYTEHRGRYQISERRSFSHLYFSPDRDGDREARARAVAAAQTLRRTRTPRDSARGDAFAGRSDYTSLTAVETTRVFGESEFSHAVFVAPVGEWSGPYRSGFGWHLIYVRLVEPARIPPLSEVLEAVRADCIEAIRQRKNAETFAAIRGKYTVVLPDGIARPASLRATPSATGSAGAD